jgi:hypothetical protein
MCRYQVSPWFAIQFDTFETTERSFCPEMVRPVDPNRLNTNVAESMVVGLHQKESWRRRK